MPRSPRADNASLARRALALCCLAALVASGASLGGCETDGGARTRSQKSSLDKKSNADKTSSSKTSVKWQ
jgi:hypothetical protein